MEEEKPLKRKHGRYEKEFEERRKLYKMADSGLSRAVGEFEEEMVSEKLLKM